MFARIRRHPRTVLLCLFAAAVVALIPVNDALAQTAETEATPPDPNRSGFTLLLTMGVAVQSNDFVNDSTVGLGGMNLGIGGFVSPELAVMFRISGSTVTFDEFGRWRNFESVSGVGGPCLQYWVNDYVNLEGGAGLGFADASPIPGEERNGFGLILGAGFSFFHRGKNSLQLGVEYAPVFTRNRNVQNVSINFGWQLL